MGEREKKQNLFRPLAHSLCSLKGLLAQLRHSKGRGVEDEIQG
jgi:hypothetical protein